MATFEAQTMVDPSPGVNALYNAQQGQWIQNQRNQLAAAASQQDLADRATLRGLAGGLAANDPTAYAGAAVLPSIGGTNTVTALTGTGDLALRQQELAFKLAQIRGANAALDSVYPGQGGTAATPGQGGPSGTFEHQLGAYEAPGGPGSENKGGYIGQFQFGASRLADLGMYAPAPGEDVSKNQWSGTFDIPGFPDVKTKADFLASPAAQHAAFQSHVGSIDTAIAQTPGADKLDPNGLRAVAHLGGLDGMRKFVASGGTYDPADSNGTHLSDYYQRFAAAGAPGLQAVFGSPHGPGGPPGVAARTGGTDVAGPGAGPAAAPPGGPAPLLVPGSSGPGPRVAPTVTPVAQNTLVPPAPAQPVVAPPPVQTAQPPPVSPAPQQPKDGPGPPTAPPAIDAQNLNAADHEALNAMKQGFKLTMNPNGAQLLQAEIEKRQAANIARAHQYWEDQRTYAGTWEDIGGGMTRNRVTGETKYAGPPTPRLTTQAGVGVIEALPGGETRLVSPVNPTGIQTQEAAKASGAAAGTATGKLVPQLAEQGARANQAISTIDEGLDNIQKAQQGGVSTGYFAPWITTGLAMAKSLGVDTKALAGVDPSAVGDIQTAKKTLGLVSGQILQQILGPESQITEGKIQQYIGATPGIETDPYALQRVLNWARSQFVYEREQAMQGMNDARAPGAGGILRPDWLPNYYATKGFGPIYNPNVGGMQQPDGQSPGREPPPPAATAPPAAAIAHLKQNPDLSGAFDQKYGVGAAKRALGQ